MSAIDDPRLSFMKLLSDFDGSVKVSGNSKKRWNMAFAAIYCSRAFHNAIKISPYYPSSTVVIDVDDQPHPCLSLTSLVRERNINELAKLGGVEGISTSLKTDQECGINGDQEDLDYRWQVFGRNTYPTPPKKSFFHFVWEKLKDLTILLPLLCAAFAFILGFAWDEGPKEGITTLAVLFLVILVSAVCNFRQNRQFEKLSEASSDVGVEVVRRGKRRRISILDVVVGDVVWLKIGDQVPADGLFMDGHSLQVDESSVSGESDHVLIDRYENPFLFSGTKVVDGYGKMVVTSVGMNTLWGEMMSKISGDSDEQTVLQDRLEKMSKSIAKIGFVVAFIVLVVLIIRYFTGNTKDEDGVREFYAGETKFRYVITAVIGILYATVTIVVVAVPEGLPLAITLALAYSMKRMMAEQAMVRKLSACETMSSVTTICTDKTGTLTLNQMKVAKFLQGNESIEGGSIARNVVELLHQGVGLNTTGSVFKSNESVEFTGSPTEKAILSWGVMELKMDMEGVKRRCEIVKVEAFNSDKKRSGVLMKKVEDDSLHVHWKGAAEMILAMCSHYYDSEGIVRALSEDERTVFDRRIEGMAASSLRCIAFAHKQVSESNSKIQENGLTLVGLVGLKDPCRPGVRQAVQDCQSAGVNVMMITGDNVFTAKAIATECGILDPNDQDESVVEGVVFRSYTEEERMDRVDNIRVMARSSPLDKLLMVQCLKEKGHVVAVTGDGANDAPALKQADIGLSMEIQGTDVARQSSDIIILDDNFASIVTVMRWGRSILNNIKKFMQFQFTVSISVLAINIVAAFVPGLEVPLTTVQLFWVNLVMDILGPLALSIQKPSNEAMQKPPVDQSEPLISNIMWRNLTAQALYQIALVLTLELKGPSILGIDDEVKRTVIFNTFVLCQIFNEFNARELERANVLKGIETNKVFVGITLVVQVMMVEFLNKFGDTKRLNLREWGICVGLAAAIWIIGLMVKLIPVPERPFSTYLYSNKLDFVEEIEFYVIE